MSGAIGGNEMYIKVSNTEMTTSSDGVRVDNLDKSTLKETAEMLEVTGFGDTFKRRKAGIKDASLDLSGSLNPDDPGQVQFGVGETVFVALYPRGLNFPGKQMECIVESVEESADVGGKQDISISLQGANSPTVIGA